MIGSIIDKYEVLQKLGEGATATVYRGRHVAIGRDVAIKVLHPHLTASTRYRERFNREARAFGRLAHPNIVSILDYSGSSTPDCYIVTELVDGVTLLELLRERGRIPSEIAAIIGVDLARALAFAHREGILHRDVKPENVMIRRDGTIKLMDFGVARILDEGSITLDGSLLGSPAYMSPQQALDETLDHRTDLFSLGTLLFHIITGHTPFSGSNPSIILRNIIDNNRPEILELAPDTAPAIAAIIDRLLQTRPDDRPHDATEVEQALARSLAEVDLSTDHPTINLRQFLLEPQQCTDELTQHLKVVLLRHGKERLGQGDHLSALQIFNRLLAMDEDNPEVVALIQSLHEAPVTRRRPVWLIGASVGAVLLAVGAWWWTRPVPQAPVEPPPVATTMPTTEPLRLPPVAIPTEPPPTQLPPIEPPASNNAPHNTNDAAPTTPGTDATRSAGRSASEQQPAEVVISSFIWAEVWLDGKKVGYTRKGPISEWVASSAAPLKVSPGEHTLMLRNDHAEPHEEVFVIGQGERKNFNIQLRRLPVTYTINPRMPRDCVVTVGSTRYGAVNDFGATFQLREPDGTNVKFSCPAPYGEISLRLGPTAGGETLIIPTTLPVVTEPTP